MRFLLKFRIPFALATCALLATGCRQESSEVDRKLGFDEFRPVYNRYIEKWLHTQQNATDKEVARLAGEIAAAEGEAKTTLELQAETLRLEQEKWKFRFGLGDFLKVGTPAEIPADLVWENGMNQRSAPLVTTRTTRSAATSTTTSTSRW